jgi:NAD(P)H dehydrogenase (quinone)
LILITGAGGKTGRALLHLLIRQAHSVRALVKSETQAEALVELGAADTVVADMSDLDSMKPAFTGVSAVYHIPPNIHPQEELIGEIAIKLSEQHGIEHFIYHSVLRPYIRAMPHHINKARVEERLFTSGIPFTILQPAAYMQNTLPGVATARDEGIFSVPYPIDTPMGMVDLAEVVEVAADIINNAAHYGATYELSGGEILTPVIVAKHMEAALGTPVKAKEVDLETWQRGAEQAGMSDYQIETLIKMFRYYAEYGFWGNANTLSALLGRTPKTYAEFLAGLDLRPSD